MYKYVEEIVSQSKNVSQRKKNMYIKIQQCITSIEECMIQTLFE